MSIVDDLPATLVSKYGYSFDEARARALCVVCAADDPNFAYAFARNDEGDETERMLNYWEVVKFLKETI